MSANRKPLALRAQKAFALPRSYEERRKLGVQWTGCSTPTDRSIGARCTSLAYWKIARVADQKRGVRYACDGCREKRYRDLETVL